MPGVIPCRPEGVGVGPDQALTQAASGGALVGHPGRGLVGHPDLCIRQSVNLKTLGTAHLLAIKAGKAHQINLDTRIDFSPICRANVNKCTHRGLPEHDLRSKSAQVRAAIR